MINESLIGQKVGAGLQHRVYAYGNDQVIKIPRFWMRLSATFAQKQRELKIIQEYLSDYIPETVVLPFRGSYCYLQTRVETLGPLKLSHLTDTHKPTLDAFLAQNKRLIEKHNMSVDVLGGATYLSVISRHMKHKPIPSTNVVTEKEKAGMVYLLDTDLLRTSPLNFTHLREIPFAVLSFGVYLVNIFLLKHYDIL